MKESSRNSNRFLKMKCIYGGSYKRMRSGFDGTISQ